MAREEEGNTRGAGVGRLSTETLILTSPLMNDRAVGSFNSYLYV